MNPDILKKLLLDIRDRKIDTLEAYDRLKTLPYKDLGFARVDHHREIRSAMAEVIYCEGKTPPQILEIIKTMREAGSEVLATRCSAETYAKIKRRLPPTAVYNPSARTIVIKKGKTTSDLGCIAIATAGTSDLPIAEEAAITAQFYGSRVEKSFDVGVAGIHRVLDRVEALREARVVIVVAGMDGALASVVGGLVDKPVIAVPTSIGYGASFGGLAALLTMLNSCAMGVATVNIDNGFGAGCLAHKINRMGLTSDG